MTAERAAQEHKFARGWFIVATSDQVGSDKPTSLRFFAKRMVAFRSNNGAPIVMDAVCPHMGADLSVGGLIEDGQILCPFHHWRYGPDGRCNHIPYCTAIPPKAKVHSYPVREINGMVFVWYDPEYGEPDFEIPDLAEYSDPRWVKWNIIRRDIRSVPLEIVDNIADSGHLLPVHFSAPRTFDVQFVGHQAIQKQLATHETLASTPGGDMKTVATYHGPSYLLTHISGRHNSWMLLAHTPIDEQHVAVWFGLMLQSDGEVTPAFMDIYRQYLAGAQVSAFQDVDIWENKSIVEQPLLCRGDGPILKAREWYRQFLRPRRSGAAAMADQSLAGC